MGSWIGGDRDGNPFVTAEVVRFAIHRQTAIALEHHLRAVHHLSRRAVDDRPTGHADAGTARTRRRLRGRLAVPRRRAVPTCAARHARPAVRLRRLRHRSGRRPPGPRADGAAAGVRRRSASWSHDLDTVISSLHTHGAAAIAERIVEPVRRGVAMFGAHLCGLDMRQNSAVHEAVVADLFAAAGRVRRLPRTRRDRPRAAPRSRVAHAPAAVVTRAPPTATSPAANSRSSTRRPHAVAASGRSSCPTT